METLLQVKSPYGTWARGLFW